MTRRSMAAALALTLILVFLCSALFIAAESEHHCVGEGCAVCCQLNACENVLRAVGYALSALIFALSVHSIITDISASVSSFYCGGTLVALKVKLSD